MRRHDLKKLAAFLGAVILLTGCTVKETARKIIGTSTKTLAARRQEGPSKTYYCSYQDCFDAIMALGRRKDSAKPWIRNDEPDPGVFNIFMSDLYANPPYIILMGVEGNIDTTE